MVKPSSDLPDYPINPSHKVSRVNSKLQESKKIPSQASEGGPDGSHNSKQNNNSGSRYLKKKQDDSVRMSRAS